MYFLDSSSVEKLCIACKEVEGNFPKHDHRPIQMPFKPRVPINEIYCAEEEEVKQAAQPATEEVAALQVNYNTFMECPKEWSIFCYKCGKPNTITPKCPVCQLGNQKKGAEKTGGPRPIENPAI